MRVLIAPDKFRGTLSAGQAAEAIAAGWRSARPADELDLAPMADGGEGTTTTLVEALGGELVPTGVHGPLGDPVETRFGLARTPDGPLAVVECAAASGLQLIPENRRDPLRTSSRGTGELIGAALDTGARRVIVGLGGSATNDGGAGMAQALGVRMLDAEGRELAAGGAALSSLAHIDMSDIDRRVAGVGFVAATDVDNPLVGRTGASAIFGPQKGASTDDVVILDRALAHLAATVHRDLGVDLRDEPGAGAAGGLGFGLMAFLGARVRSGVDVVSEALGIPRRVAASQLVITGEGRFDAQSLRGKAPAGVLRSAREAGVPAAVLCGDLEAGTPPDGVQVMSLSELFGMDRALADAWHSLEEAARALAERAVEPTEPGR